MIRVGIIGATGYAGAELARLITAHPKAEIVWYGSKSYTGQRYEDIFRNFRGMTKAVLKDDDLSALSKEADVIFTATPQGFLASVIDEEILSNCRVIDLSADFRLKDVSVYEAWYGITHKAPQYIKEAVYGLTELARERVKDARLVANPGCYTTCSILTLTPAVRAGLIDTDTIVIDALSGVSGAGRGAKTDNLFSEVDESAKPYGVASHRHTPEIEEQLTYAAGKAVTLTFTPHLVPMQRGILATCYATLRPDVTAEKVRSVYEEAYGDEFFIRLLPDGMLPETRYVAHGNFVDIAFKIDERTNRLILMGALDNIVKGAAGQAVQNMNVMFSLDERTGLDMPPAFL